MSNWITIVGILTSFIVILLFFINFSMNFAIKEAKRKFIFPYMKSIGYKIVQIERLPRQAWPSLFKVKGNFKNTPIPPWGDTAYNNKIYIYIYYIDNKGKEGRTTAKISNNIFICPIKVDYFPKITSSP